MTLHKQELPRQVTLEQKKWRQQHLDVAKKSTKTMMSSCYSAYSATPGKVMPLDPIGRKTLQATGRSKTNKKTEISRHCLQSNCHDVQLLLRLLRYSRQSDAPRSYRQKDIAGNRSE